MPGSGGWWVRVPRAASCSTCGSTSDVLLWQSESLWHDPEFHCSGCGDAWTEEGRLPIPAKRGWRDEERARLASVEVVAEGWDAYAALVRSAHDAELRWLAGGVLS